MLESNQIEYKSLEGMRFIASAAIVSHHFIPYLTLAPPVGGRLAYFVDLFFVISGVVIAHRYAGRLRSPKAYFAFVQRRLARLYPLHTATLAFYVIVGWLALRGSLTVANLDKYNFDELVPNLLMIHAWRPNGIMAFNYVSWSVSAELFVYLSFPLVVAAVAKDLRLGLLVVVAVLLSSAFIIEREFDLVLTETTTRLGILRALPSFAFGVWIACHGKNLALFMDGRRARHCFSVATAILAVSIFWGANAYLVLAICYAVVLAAYLADVAGEATWAATDAIASRGYLTYGIYMLHPIAATLIISWLMPRLVGSGDWAKLLAILVATVLTYVGAVLSYRIFESPMRRRLSPTSFRKAP